MERKKRYSIRRAIQKILAGFNDKSYALIMSSQLTAQLLNHQIRKLRNTGIYQTADELLQGIELDRPDIIIFSSRINNGEANDALKMLKASGQEIISIVFVSDEHLGQDFSLFDGAIAEKDVGSQERPAVNAIHCVIGGGKYTSTSLQGKGARKQPSLQEKTGHYGQLSPREESILECFDRGMSNREISATLNITENTVKSYCKIILRKLRTKNRHLAVTRWKSISPPPQGGDDD